MRFWDGPLRSDCGNHSLRVGEFDTIAAMSIKILHAAHMRTPMAGVIRQMEDEQKSAQAIGIDWDARLFCPIGTPGDICIRAEGGNGWMHSKREFYRWLVGRIPDYDVLLLRYARCDPFQLKFIRNASIPVLTVHHTLELNQADGQPSIKEFCRKLTEIALGRTSLRQVSGVVGVTREIAEYSRQRSGRKDLPMFVYPNGATYGDNNNVVAKKLVSNVPELLFVASNFGVWIGLDLLIDSVQKSNENFVIHIVGGVSVEQLSRLKQDSRFVIHGMLGHNDIRSLIARSSLGIGSLALFRNKMTEGNTLKVKEYLRAGLPVYAGYRDVFDDTFPYYTYGKPNIGDMLAFAEKHKTANPKDISDLAKPHIEKGVLLKQIYDRLSDCYSSV